jgi:hypothetical protein
MVVITSPIIKEVLEERKLPNFLEIISIYTERLTGIID